MSYSYLDCFNIYVQYLYIYERERKFGVIKIDEKYKIFEIKYIFVAHTRTVSHK